MSAIMEDMMEQQTAIAVIPASAVSIIVGADPNDILGKLSAKVQQHKGDVSTPRGRDEIRSLAAEIARSKMDLIRLGKGLTEDWRKQTKAVNAECSVLEERMDALKEEVRRPLTEYENRERDRVAGHEAALAAILEGPFWGQDETAADIQARLDYLNTYPARAWEEFAQRANEALANEIARTEGLLAQAQKREAEAAELARLRAETQERARLDAVRAQEEREARIAAEAAERAKQEAEERAERQRQETLRVAAEERARAEEAQQAVIREREAAEARAQKAEQDRIDAERRAEDARVAAAAQAERDKAEAVAAEQRRAAAAKAAEEEEAARRAANKAHKAKINNEVVAALMADPGLSLDTAKAVVVAIAGGKVPSLRIEY